MPKIENKENEAIEQIASNPWKTIIDDTPGNTSEKLKELGALPGLTYNKIYRVYNGDTPDLRSSDAIKVLIKLNEWRGGKMDLIVPQAFFLSLRVHLSEQL